MKDKIRVYVYSLKDISTLDYIDTKSMGHPCVTGRGGDIFVGMKNLPSGSWNGYLQGDQRKTVRVVDEFCRENGLEYEIVDVATLRFTDKMKLALKGTKAPAVTFREKKIEGVPTKENLSLLTA